MVRRCPGAIVEPEMWFHFPDGFAIQCNYKVQNAMGGRMLGSYINDYIAVCCCAYFFNHSSVP